MSEATITFTPEEMLQIAAWGTARTEENKGRGDIADYDSNRFNLNPEQNNRLGVMTEAAVYKWCGYSLDDIDLNVWAPFVPTSQYHLLKQPDIAGVIEVRRANRINSPIPIRRKDVEGRAVLVQGFVNYAQAEWLGPIRVPREVSLLGWCDAVQDWPLAEEAGWARGSGMKSRILKARRHIEDLDLAALLEKAA